MSDQTSSTGTFYTVSLIFSLLGGLLVLIEDFAGWTEVGFYTTDYYLWVGSENAPFYSQVILVLIGLALFFTAYVSFLGMQDKLSSELLARGLQVSLTTFFAVIVGAFVFFSETADAVDSWLDTGFYASLIGSAVTAFFLYQAQKSS